MQSESEEGVLVLELEDDILFFYLGVGSVKFFFTSLLYIVASQVTTCLLGFLSSFKFQVSTMSWKVYIYTEEKRLVKLF